MKTRFLILTVLGVITTLIIYSCNITQGTISTINNTICSNYPDMNTMEVQLIHKMTDKYKTNQLAAINNSSRTIFSPNYSDARAIWFDLETLKAFIHQIEIKAKNNVDPVPSTDLGIRIYYGSYPEESTWGSTYKDLPGTGNNVLTPDYQERHTLVLVPTIRKDTLDVDFNPLDPKTYKTPFLETEEYINGIMLRTGNPTSILALPAIPSSGDTGAQNHGGLYPPLGNSGLAF